MAWGPGPGLQDPGQIQVQLTNVQTAIANIETSAQSYSIANRNATKANLATLYERERQLLARLSRSNAAYVYGYNAMFGRGRVLGTGQS
jgi:hypothetical protein